MIAAWCVLLVLVGVCWVYEREMEVCLAALPATGKGDNLMLSEKLSTAGGRKMARKRTYEAPEMGEMLRRVTRAMGKRAAGGEIEALAVLAEIQTEIQAAMAVGARGAHAFGFSWSEIGDVLGISRQGARQRFGATGDEEA